MGESLSEYHQRLDAMRDEAHRGAVVDVAVSLYNSGMSLRQIAKELGVSHTAVWKILRGRVKKPLASGRIPKEVLDEALERYAKGIGLHTLSKELGVHKNTLRKAFEENGVMLRSAADGRRARRERNDQDHTPRVLELFRLGYPIAEIAKMCGTSIRRVMRIVRSTQTMHGSNVLGRTPSTTNEGGGSNAR